jgi:hypothetical protein
MSKNKQGYTRKGRYKENRVGLWWSEIGERERRRRRRRKSTTSKQANKQRSREKWMTTADANGSSEQNNMACGIRVVSRCGSTTA